MTRDIAAATCFKTHQGCLVDALHSCASRIFLVRFDEAASTASAGTPATLEEAAPTLS